ncbi:ribonuclease III [bacterium]|nr:ribonuclease III [bacterium]
MKHASIQELESALGYRFTQTGLLSAALTHPSHREARQHAHDFERLEFLGDAVLGLVVAHLLFDLYPDEREGELARRKALLVARATLVKVATAWHLPKALRLSGAEEARGGRSTATTIEDACEAVIGAVFLDGGYEAARQLVLRAWTPLAREIVTPPKDARTALQEWAQGRGLPLPHYEVVAQSGTAHQPIFRVRVSVNGHDAAEAEGKSKKAAWASAAETLFEKVSRHGE